jgi:hypothetical protein
MAGLELDALAPRSPPAVGKATNLAGVVLLGQGLLDGDKDRTSLSSLCDMARILRSSAGVA